MYIRIYLGCCQTAKDNWSRKNKKRRGRKRSLKSNIFRKGHQILELTTPKAIPCSATNAFKDWENHINSPALAFQGCHSFFLPHNLSSTRKKPKFLGKEEQRGYPYPGFSRKYHLSFCECAPQIKMGNLAFVS